jgi:hypothetical protein
MHTIHTITHQQLPHMPCTYRNKNNDGAQAQQWGCNSQKSIVPPFLNGEEGHPFNQIVTSTDVHATFYARHNAAEQLYFNVPIWLRILYAGHWKV